MQPSYGITSVMRRSFSAWRPYWKLGGLILFTLLVQQLFQTFLAYSLKLIIDNVQTGRNDPSLALILAGLGIGFLLNAGAALGGERATARSGGLLMGDLRRRLYEKLQEMSAEFYVRNSLGDIMARFTGDLAVIELGFTQATFNTLLTALGLLINVPVMLSLDWRLGLLGLLSLPLIVLVNRRLVPGAGEATYVLKRSEGALANTVQESVRAHLFVKSFGLQQLFRERFAAEVAQLVETNVRSRFAIALVGKGSSLIIMLIQLVVTGAGAFLALRGDLSAGSLIAFLSILAVVSKDAYEFAKKAVPAYLAAGSGLRRLDEILLAVPAIVDAPRATTLPRLQRTIRFDEVDFGYTAEHPALTGLTLEIPQGQSVAFVGPSGSGKSTTLSLLLRFYEPQHGRVLFDERDIAQATQASLRAQMGVVFQENFLFNDSVLENIRLARPEATDAMVVEAARAAEIHDLIQTLPQAYHTPVGEAGGRLSGGQRQRIAIARAILRDPAILLLDEATSALDSTTEAAVNATIAQLGRGRTVISVTHRLQSAAEADRIFVLRAGRLVESGSHRELLERRGLYHALWQKQSGFAISDDGRQASVSPERLQQMPLFTALSVDELAQVTALFASEYYAAGETVFTQGESGDRFYLLVRGQVAVQVTDAQGIEQTVELLEDGDHFGEMALLQDKPRNASIRTLSPCNVLSLSRRRFTELVARYPAMQPAIDRRIARSEANLSALRPAETAH